jgi:hypothetical protein
MIFPLGSKIHLKNCPQKREDKNVFTEHVFLPEGDEDVGEGLASAEDREHDPVHHPFDLENTFLCLKYFRRKKWEKNTGDFDSNYCYLCRKRGKIPENRDHIDPDPENGLIRWEVKTELTLGKVILTIIGTALQKVALTELYFKVG